MSLNVKAELVRLKKLVRNNDQAATLTQYQTCPVDYIKDVLDKDLTPTQKEICQLMLEPPYRVLVKSAHKVGKSFLAACLINWRYDCFNPSAVISTAPTREHVQDVLWTEVRLLRGMRGGFIGSSAPELRTAPDRFAKGFTTAKPEAFQGRHRTNAMYLFDESVGIESVVWQVCESMFKRDGSAIWLAFHNPTDSSTEAHQQEMLGTWHVVTMSALDHPNIASQLAGDDPPFPAAITLDHLDEMLKAWAEPIDIQDKTATDLEWPPGSGKWIHPGPLCEARLLGRWPSQAAYSIWSDALWASVMATRHELDPRWKIQIGCDVARFGDDMTTIHVRQGLCSLHHEAHNGWSTSRTAGRLKQLCNRFAGKQDQKRIACLIDVTGVGAGVVDQADGFNFVPVNSSEIAGDGTTYPNVRSALWFAAAEWAKRGCIDVSRLDKKSLQELGRQLLAPMYDVDQAGRLRVEEKAQTKKRLKTSPDHADSFNLAYFKVGNGSEVVSGVIG